VEWCPPTGARRRRGFSPELLHATWSQPNQGKIEFVYILDLRQKPVVKNDVLQHRPSPRGNFIFFILSTCGRRKWEKNKRPGVLQAVLAKIPTDSLMRFRAEDPTLTIRPSGLGRMIPDTRYTQQPARSRYVNTSILVCWESLVERIDPSYPSLARVTAASASVTRHKEK